MTDFSQALQSAAKRLTAKAIARAGDSLSIRLPQTGQFAVLTFGNETAILLCDLALPAPDLHGQIYAARADVGAIFVGGLAWTCQLAAMDQSLPWVFDEQIRQLGPTAPRVRAKRSGQMPASALATGANAFCLDDAAICCGTGLARLLLNIEILEKCAQSYVLAAQTGQKVARIPWLVKLIATRRLKRDQIDAARRHLRGEMSVFKAGY